MSTWTYDGAHVLTIATTFDDQDQANSLYLNCDEPNESFKQVFGNVGDPTTLTVTTINNLSAGDIFVANLSYQTTFFDTDFGSYSGFFAVVTKEARLFTYGTPGSGVPYQPTWHFDGVDVTISFILDTIMASGDVLGDPPGVFGNASDCNSSGFSNFSPGAVGSLFTGTITGVGHCDTSPFGAGESFHVGFFSSAAFPLTWGTKITVVAGITADFSGNPTSGAAPLMVCFTDLTTGGTPTSWSWDFGDGGTSTLQNPCHLYAAPGVYTVTLTVSDGVNSDTKTRTGYVVVGAFAEVFLATKGGFRTA